MNQKTKLILVVLLLAAVALAGYYFFFGPEAVEGEKEVTVHIINEGENVDETMTFTTDAAFLIDLLKEQEEALQPEIQEADFGAFLSGIYGYTANPSNEYFQILINDEAAMVGISEIPVQDGDTYTFQLTGF